MIDDERKIKFFHGTIVFIVETSGRNFIPNMHFNYGFSKLEDISISKTRYCPKYVRGKGSRWKAPRTLTPVKSLRSKN